MISPFHTLPLSSGFGAVPCPQGAASGHTTVAEVDAAETSSGRDAATQRQWCGYRNSVIGDAYVKQADLRSRSRVPAAGRDAQGACARRSDTSSNVAVEIVSQIDLENDVANLSLLTQITADEAWEAMLATEAALHHWVEALADGEVTPEEAAIGIEKLEVALREAREAKLASDITYKRNRASETLMREDADALFDGIANISDYRRDVLKNAGVQPIAMPDNVREFRRDDAPAAG